MNRFLSLPFCLAASLGLAGCIFGGSDSSGPSYLRVESTISYTQQGNSIITKGGRVDTLRTCGASSLPVVELITQPDDTTSFEINGETLSLFQRPIALDAHAVIRYVSVHTRLSGGPGLLGKWRWKGYEYQVMSGALTAGEKEFQDLQRDNFLDLLSRFTYTVEFTAGKMISTTDRSPARAFVEEWNSGTAILYSDPTGFDISIRMLNATTVELKGKISGETLRVTLSESNSDFQVSSSDKTHADFTYRENPVSCPNVAEPAWYGDFLGANSK